MTGEEPRGGRLVRAMVLDANERSALAATRSLGGHAVPVVAADEIRFTLAGASRYCQRTLTYPSPYSRPDAFIAALRAAIAEHDIGLVFPMTEVTTELLLRRRDELGGAAVPFGSLAAFEQLNDKRQLADLARELGVPAPRTVSVESVEELGPAAAEIGFPVAVKPYRSRIPSGTGFARGAVQYARSAGELSTLVAGDPVFRAHPFLLQEYVEGHGQGVFALYDRGQAVAFFAHRRVRERPPSGGVSVVSESVGVDPELRQMAERILDRVGWHGVAMVEFKVTPEGRPYLIEVNPRFWGSLQLAIDAGMDFPWLLYQLSQRTLEQPPREYRLGVRTRWLLGDLDHLYLRLRDEKGIRHRLGALGAFLRPLGRGARHEVNRWDDWRPFARELRQYFAGPGR